MNFKINKITLMTLLILVASSLYADFKIMGGLNLSNYKGDENTIWSYKMGLQGGLGIELDITYRTLFEVDILFFRKGSRTGSSLSEERHILNTMSIPVLLRSKLFHGTSPYIVGGVEFAGIISNFMHQKGEEPVDLDGTLKRLDIGVVFGAGFEMEIKEKLFLFIEARSHVGQKNLLVLPSEGLVRKTTAFVLLIGIRS
ncbi:MAG: porin family protein [Candidatus Aminicenantes bacterium]|nr:porin family protein [Candidatus Aminicenantes bacterium]